MGLYDMRIDQLLFQISYRKAATIIFNQTFACESTGINLYD